MSAEIKIKAEPRSEFGKGAARRIRRADKVPAVLYGHGTDPLHLTLPGHELMLALKTANALLTIEIDGDSHLALPKQVQRDPIKGFIEHADLLLVRQGEKVTVDVHIVVVGTAAPETLLNVEHPTVPLEVEATHIPQSIEVSVEGLPVGSQVLAKDLTLPTGAALAIDPEALVVHVTAQQSAAELEADLAGAEAELGVEHEAPQGAGADAAPPAGEEGSAGSGEETAAQE